jgi:hypothetical protein
MGRNDGIPIDRSNPEVQAFLAACGLSEHAVSIRLIGETESDVNRLIDQLHAVMPERFQFSRARQQVKGLQWLAYGTLLG